MGALTWDADGERLFETGVDHAVLYLMNDDGSYQNGVAWNGITGITESPEGAEANDIYADNIKYLSLISKEDWKGTIKAYTFPKEFNECMGNFGVGTAAGSGTTPGTLGFKAHIGQQKRRKFALSWRTRLGNDTVGDSFAYKIHIAWGLSAAPSEMDHATENDSPEAQEFSWEISSIPPQATSKVPVDGSTTEETKKAIQPCAHVFAASKIVTFDGQKNNDTENTAITALEDYLYGHDADGTTEESYATIPTLTQLIDCYSDGSYAEWEAS